MVFGLEKLRQRETLETMQETSLGPLECWILWKVGREILRSAPFVEKKRELGVDDCWGGGTRANRWLWVERRRRQRLGRSIS
jgi:hypothetical protein